MGGYHYVGDPAANRRASAAARRVGGYGELIRLSNEAKALHRKGLASKIVKIDGKWIAIHDPTQRTGRPMKKYPATDEKMSGWPLAIVYLVAFAFCVSCIAGVVTLLT